MTHGVPKYGYPNLKPINNRVVNNWQLETERKLTMALNKKSLGTLLLQLTKGANDVLANSEFTIDEFAIVNENGDEEMICFTVKEIEDTYFWASTLLFDFFKDNIENAIWSDETLAYHFADEDVVTIKYEGKVPLKNDPNKSCNVWKVIC